MKPFSFFFLWSLLGLHGCGPDDGSLQQQFHQLTTLPLRRWMRKVQSRWLFSDTHMVFPLPCSSSFCVLQQSNGIPCTREKKLESKSSFAQYPRLLTLFFILFSVSLWSIGSILNTCTLILILHDQGSHYKPDA